MKTNIYLAEGGNYKVVPESKVITNGEKLRSLSDESLAIWLKELGADMPMGGWIAWLKAPYAEGD